MTQGNGPVATAEKPPEEEAVRTQSEEQAGPSASEADDSEPQVENHTAPNDSDETPVPVASSKGKKRPRKAKTQASATKEKSSPATSSQTKRKRVDCCHDYGFLELYTNDQGHFKETFLKSHQLWPSKCFDCAKNFVVKPIKDVNEHTEYRVSSKTPVHMCKCGANSLKECLFALCTPCHRGRRPAEGTPKKERPKKSRLDM